MPYTRHRDPEDERTCRLAQEAEARAEAFDAGRLDHEFGEWLARTQQPNALADEVQAHWGGECRVTPEDTLELDTYASLKGWRRPKEFIVVSLTTIGETFRATQDPLCEEFLRSLYATDGECGTRCSSWPVSRSSRSRSHWRRTTRCSTRT